MYKQTQRTFRTSTEQSMRDDARTLPTFMPFACSNNGRQYTGTGTGTCDWRGASFAAAVAGATRAGSDQPYACKRPSSFFTCTCTCLYWSRRSFSRSFRFFSDTLQSWTCGYTHTHTHTHKLPHSSERQTHLTKRRTPSFALIGGTGVWYNGNSYS